MDSRLGSFNTYDKALKNLYRRQSELSGLQEKLTSGKDVNRPSDDPTGAAQAERDMVRLARVATDQRTLEAKRTSMTIAESTLGQMTDINQRLRELMVQAGNGANNGLDRLSIANEMQGLRDQLFSLSNSADNNGIPLFGGLGSAAAPYTDPIPGVVYNGIPGQIAATDVTIPGALNGHALLMNVPTGNGMVTMDLAATNTGTLWTDQGQILNPTILTGHDYNIVFTVTPPTAPGLPEVITYDVIDATLPAGSPKVLTAQPYKSLNAIAFDGITLIAQGTPANGDTVTVKPSTPASFFAVVDKAIAGIGQAKAGATFNHELARSLVQFDAGVDRLHSARGQAGAWLNRADNIESNLQTRTIQLTADRSRAEDLDFIKGTSDYTKANTGYQAALQSYASVQKLSLFNYLNL